MIGKLLVFIMVISMGTYLLYEKAHEESMYSEAIQKAEQLFKEGLKTQLPIEEQIEELRKIEIKLYGKEVSDYDAIRDNAING